jgi:hypothetical protein
MVANFEKVSATPTNRVPLKPQTGKMLSLSFGACNRNNPDSGRAARAATQTQTAIKHEIADRAS